MQILFHFCWPQGAPWLWDTLHTAWLREEKLQEGQARCAACHTLAKWPLSALGVPQEQPWVFIPSLPLSPGVRDRDCPLEAKYPHPKSLFGR